MATDSYKKCSNYILGYCETTGIFFTNILKQTYFNSDIYLYNIINIINLMIHDFD